MCKYLISGRIAVFKEHACLARQVLRLNLATKVVSIDLGAGHMSCKDTIHLICWYLEGRLSSSVEVEIKRHLQNCPDCHMVLEAAISTLDHYFASEGVSAAGASPQAA